MGNIKSQKQSDFQATFLFQKDGQLLKVYDQWNYLFEKQQQKFQMRRMIKQLQQRLLSQICVIIRINPIIIQQTQKKKGMIYYRGQQLYYGQIKNNLYQGNGIIFYPENTVFKGSFLKGKMDGMLKVYNNKKLTLTGRWRNNKFLQGKIEGSNIELFKMNKLNNYKLRFKNGIVYQGQIKYKNNELKLQGRGDMSFINKQRYIGNWKQNKKDGEGKYIYLDGKQFIGQWKNDEVLSGKLIQNGNIIKQI